jgi:hypothetical protein
MPLPRFETRTAVIRVWSGRDVKLEGEINIQEWFRLSRGYHYREVLKSCSSALPFPNGSHTFTVAFLFLPMLATYPANLTFLDFISIINGRV